MTPGEKVGAFVTAAVDKHFDEEVADYIKRHPVKPDELEVRITPGKNDFLVLTLQPRDPRLVLPKRIFKMLVRLE